MPTESGKEATDVRLCQVCSLLPGTLAPRVTMQMPSLGLGSPDPGLCSP